MNDKLKLMAMFAAMMSIHGKSNSNDYIELKETEEERKKRLSEAEIVRFKRHGLKPFNYRSTTIWAINKKAADKKARKQNLL